MEDKKAILLVALVTLAIAAAAMMAIASKNIEVNHPYTTLALSNKSTIEVPITQMSSKSIDGHGIRHYADSQNNLNITSFNSREGAYPAGAAEMASIRDEILLESDAVLSKDNITVYQNPNTKAYSILTGNETTHDSIVIVSDDLDEVLHAYGSIHYGEIDF